MRWRTNAIARQLRELMERHEAMPADIERLTKDEVQPPIAAVTVRRILQSTAKKEPDTSTLKRIAAAFGETLEQAFPGDGKAFYIKCDNGEHAGVVIVPDGDSSEDLRRHLRAMIKALKDVEEQVK